MKEMEMRNGYEFSADRALRDEIMSCGDKFFMMGSNRPVMSAERERFLSVLFGSRSFRG